MHLAEEHAYMGIGAEHALIACGYEIRAYACDPTGARREQAAVDAACPGDTTTQHQS